MENERASVSTHAIMDKVREMDLYPVVPAEGRFTSSMRLARAMKLAHNALSASEKYGTSGIPGDVKGPISPAGSLLGFPRHPGASEPRAR
jgi:hypothetical protein